MSQADLFAEPARHGGYHPDSNHTYRGCQVPVTYQEQEGMRVVRKPTMIWLLDDILDALHCGPILRRELHSRLIVGPGPATVSRHLHLLIDLGLVRMDYRFKETRNAGGADPAMIELVEG